jgi:pimeloyl-ACP methyl ester carboxylesterase
MTDIFVRQDGPADGPALVLIHGTMSSTRSWDAVAPMLARSHRVIRVDLLGHGRSPKPAGGGYRIPEQAQRVAATLDRLDVKQAIVLGHSSGGLTATALAEQRPDLVTALALVDTGPQMDAFIGQGRVGELLTIPVVGRLLWALRTDRLIRQAASTAVSRPGYVIPQDLVEDVRGVTHHVFLATNRAGADYLTERSLPDRLAALGVPLLVIFGEDDRRWRSSSAAGYRVVPGARIEMLPGVGHTPILEDPPRTADLLLEFIAVHTA